MGWINRYRFRRLAKHFADYRPVTITPALIENWFQQFPEKDSKAVLLLLRHVIFLNEKAVQNSLVQQNKILVAKLQKAGIPPEKTIYVSVHDAGSSSPVMLNLLRDGARLERTPCHLIDGNNGILLNKTTNTLGEGAIIYVDDFAATANQLTKTRKFISQSIVGNFAEFVLLPCICEEAIHKLGSEGLDYYAGRVHTIAERPLHEECTTLDDATKERLRNICLGIHRRMGLGYEQLATMVILYRNAPNTTPLILRGNIDQNIFVGIFPRTTELTPP